MRPVCRTSFVVRSRRALALPSASALALLVLLGGCSFLSLDNLDSAPSGVEEASDVTTDGAGGDAAVTTSGAGGDASATTSGAGDGGAGAGVAGEGGAGGGAGGGDPGCVDDAEYTALALGGSCYWRSKEPATWLDARDLCADLGGGAHLATLTTSAELDVHGLLYPEGCEPLDGDNGNDPCDQRAFIGASLSGTLGEDPWDWVNGEPWTWPNGVLEPWTNETEPNEAFLALWIDGTLDGRPNEKSLPYLCETAIE